MTATGGLLLIGVRVAGYPPDQPGDERAVAVASGEADTCEILDVDAGQRQQGPWEHYRDLTVRLSGDPGGTR
jgi:hypothetical protein